MIDIFLFGGDFEWLFFLLIIFWMGDFIVGKEVGGDIVMGDLIEGKGGGEVMCFVSC